MAVPTTISADAAGTAPADAQPDLTITAYHPHMLITFTSNTHSSDNTCATARLRFGSDVEFASASHTLLRTLRGDDIACVQRVLLHDVAVEKLVDGATYTATLGPRLAVGEWLRMLSPGRLYAYVYTRPDLLWLNPYRAHTACAAEAAVADVPQLLEHVPHAMQTEVMCLRAISAHASMLPYADPACLTPVLYDALDLSRCVAQAFPCADDTPRADADARRAAQAALQEALAAARAHGIEGQTPAIAAAVVACHGSALQFVRPDLRTPPLCEAAVAASASALACVPLAHRTPAMCASAVARDGRVLEHIPPADITPSMALAAVREYGRALAHVPPRLMTHELACAALVRSHIAIKYVPPELLSERLIADVVKVSPIMVEAIDRAAHWTWQQRAAWYDVAVCSNWRALAYVPHEYVTLAMCAAALAQHPSALMHMPTYLQESACGIDMVVEAVTREPQALEYVAACARTRVEAALSSTASAAATASAASASV